MTCPDSARRPWLVVVILAAFLALEASAAWAQRGATKGRGRGRAGSRTFPSWEQEEDRIPGRVLPVAPTGRHEIVAAHDCAGPVIGACAIADGRVAAVLATGAILILNASGESEGRLEAGLLPRFAPVALAGGVVVASDSAVALVRPSGVAWTRPLEAPLAAPPAAAGAGVIALAEGEAGLALVSAETGATFARATLPAALAAGPVKAQRALVAATKDGRLVGLDESDARMLWSVQVLETVHGLAADTEAAYAVGVGPTGRHRRTSAPAAVRLALADGGRSAASRTSWTLRLGARVATGPLLLGEAVAFASGDGFVHAVHRVRGTEAWRTDLPAKARVAPLRAGGRLDFVLPPTGYVVALSADNGAVMGGTALPDEDETFVGPAAACGSRVACATNLGRVVLLEWRYDDPNAPGPSRSPRPGQGTGQGSAPGAQEGEASRGTDG